MADKHNESSLAQVWEDRGPEAIFAGHLKRWRAARGWSQQDLAERMAKDFGYGWHQTTVARVEGRSRPLRLNEAIALGMLFDVGLDELLQPPPATLGEMQELRAQEERLRAHERELAVLRDQAEHQLHEAHARMAEIEDRHRSIVMELEHIRRRVLRAREDMEFEARVPVLGGRRAGVAPPPSKRPQPTTALRSALPQVWKRAGDETTATNGQDQREKSTDNRSALPGAT